MTEAVTTGPRSAISSVSSTSSQDASSRSPPPSKPSMLRPRAFWDLASRPRRRSRRPSVGAMDPTSGALGAASVVAAGASMTGASMTGVSVTGASMTGASATGASMTGVSVTGGSVTGGSGSRTSAMGRLTESRGTAASSPTPGSVAVPDDCVNDMPEEAVYPPDRSIGVAPSELRRRLIRRRRYRTRPRTSAATIRTAMTAIAIQRPCDTVPLFQGAAWGRATPAQRGTR
ncbi:pentapeptide repeat-containing protein [Mycolicibacterium sp. CH28]|uniref:pentapeptide repeat-containing protein n=1 Tax=Mycolicibacterium sp. CH28 TaxID=2512237 RepID=UPI0035191B48